MVVWLNPGNFTLEIPLTEANMSTKIQSESPISLQAVLSLHHGSVSCRQSVGAGGDAELMLSSYTAPPSLPPSLPPSPSPLYTG